MYSLMGAGVYGDSGLNPVVSAHLWKIYVIPRVIYSWRSCLTPYLMYSLSRGCRVICSEEYCLYCSGELFAWYSPHWTRARPEKTLSLLCSVLSTGGTLEQDIAMRQIAVKDSDCHSWFTVCNQVLHKYNLPNIYILQQHFSSEVSCKQESKAQVDSFVAELWCSEAKIKTTLQYLNINSCKAGEVHPCWKTVANSPRDVRRVITKVRLLTGTYYLQKKQECSSRMVLLQIYVCSALLGPRIGFILLLSVMRLVLSDKVISQF